MECARCYHQGGFHYERNYGSGCSSVSPAAPGDPAVQCACTGFEAGPERAGREGDSQPMPTVNNAPDVQSAVIADIEARREVGIKRYGTPLQPHNGRNALLDAYEETIDLACYLKQRLIEEATP